MAEANRSVGLLIQEHKKKWSGVGALFTGARREFERVSNKEKQSVLCFEIGVGLSKRKMSLTWLCYI